MDNWMKILTWAVIGLTTLIIWGDPFRIGKERKPFKASSYMVNLVYCLGVIIVCVYLLFYT